MTKPTIRIRYGASANEVHVDGHIFDLSVMSGRDKTFLRKTVAAGLVKAGVIHA